MTTLTWMTEHPRSLRADGLARLLSGGALPRPLQREPEIKMIKIEPETENRGQVGFMQGMLSCACKPCTPASDLPTSATVTALPSRTASVPKSGEAGMGGEEADQHVLQF